MTFKPRTTAPSTDNKYYIHTSGGGYNKCIKIKGYDCLPNCVGYAYGRFMECVGKTSCKLPMCNAEDWYAKSPAYNKGQTPKVGAVMCFRKGKVNNSSDGAGHVLIVEQINSDGSILCSQSGYKSSRFWTSIFKPPFKLNGYTFQGFIYNPDVVEAPKAAYTGTFPVLEVKTTTPAKMTHASTSGVEKVKGGKAGDQTGKEVCTIAFKYSSKVGNHFHWQYVARPNSSTTAKKIAQAMVDCANNNNIGYDQSQRLTLYTQAKKVKWVIKDIKTKCETDCSATVRVALKVAGIDVPSTFRTKNMTANLKATGKFTIYKYSSVKNNLKVGDILYYPHYHTAVITSVTTKTETKALVKGDSRSTQVKNLQGFLTWYGCPLSKDGDFGAKTLEAVKKFQKAEGLVVDGIFGVKSLAKAKAVKK